MNPKYRGKKSIKRVKNPLFEELKEVWKLDGVVRQIGIEILSESGGVFFDNFLVSDSMDDV